MSEEQPEQERLFNPERFPPMRVAAYLQLPEASARSFAVAGALGRIVRTDGTFEPLGTMRDAAGVVVGRAQRKRVMAALNIKAERWRRLIIEWESRYVAHRCSGDSTCLFVRPFLEECPACRAYIHVEAKPRPPDARRRPRPPLLVGGPTPPSRRANTPQQEESHLSTGRVFVPAHVHPKVGSEQGDERGLGMDGVDVKPPGPNLDLDRGEVEKTRTCLRCARYGRGHIGTHITTWAEERL